MQSTPQNRWDIIYKKCDEGTMVNKRDNLRPFPDYIDVELTNYCNLQCTMCPTGLNISSRPKGFISSELVRRIILECSQYNCGIRFVRWGEPLLHPHCVEYIKAIKGVGLSCHINTNGTLIDAGFISDILKAKLDSIKISYHKDVTLQIRELYLKRGKRPYPHILVGTTVNEIKNDPEFEDRVKSISDKVVISRTKNLIDTGQITTNYGECPEVFNKLSVNWDGKVTACCADWDGLLIIGDIKKQSLKEIWNSKSLQQIRDVLITRWHNTLPVCRNCII